MPISVNSVLHYTRNLANLKSIISEGAFHVKYCSEIVTGVESAFPMVCFCDIPLSQAKAHTKKYGKYAVGLTKMWATKVNLNPVLYINDDSYLDKLLKSTGRKLTEDFKSASLPDRYWLNNFISLVSFVKSVRGKRGDDESGECLTFYDEREWRYIPNKEQLKSVSFENISPSAQIFGKTYKRNKDHFNKYLKDLKLSFEPSDISYIIVSETKEINEIISHMKKTYSSLSNDELELSISKLLTMEQIEQDF